jgi:hypothetical protein
MSDAAAYTLSADDMENGMIPDPPTGCVLIVCWKLWSSTRAVMFCVRGEQRVVCTDYSHVDAMLQTIRAKRRRCPGFGWIVARVPTVGGVKGASSLAEVQALQATIRGLPPPL